MGSSWAGNHFGVLLPASSLQARVRGRGTETWTRAVPRWAEVLVRDLEEGPESQALKLQLQKAQGLTAGTHILAEWPWLRDLTSLSLRGLICEKRP